MVSSFPLSFQIAAATGQFNRVPVINGSNHDEARFMIAMNEVAGKSGDCGEVSAAVFADLVRRPGLSSSRSIRSATMSMPTKRSQLFKPISSFACPARLADQALSNYVPVFAYEFNDENAPEIFLPPVSYPYGAAHESELQYFFPAEDLTHMRDRLSSYALTRESCRE